MEELLDIFTRDGKYLGYNTRSFCHQDNVDVYHKCVFVWFINSNNEILVSKRNINKKQYPGKWQMAVAGHVDKDESVLVTAIRETKEEIGIDINEDEISYLREWIIDEQRELAQIYLVNKDISIADIKIEKEEFDEIKWLEYNEFVKLFYSDEFCEYEDKGYKDYMVKVLKG